MSAAGSARSPTATSRRSATTPGAASNIATIPISATQQETAKYERLADFGRALPKLRKRVEEDLAGKPTVRDAVVAAVVRLIDATQMRVGNEEYAKENKSFGATTLRNRHAKVEPAASSRSATPASTASSAP